ncbi:hypothetical protein V492_08421 [Pseudogymnoascus sp. VKM F-4246]|nr:hypothetical protein V492_08421 [Pseudogymnoascus sp. VKM F-4246]
MPSPTGAVKGGESRYLSGPSAEERQRAIDFANKLATHNDSQEEVVMTRQIILQEWLFATDGDRSNGGLLGGPMREGNIPQRQGLGKGLFDGW